MRVFQKYRFWGAAAAAIGGIGVCFALFSFWRASRTLEETERQVAAEHHFGFRAARFDRVQRNGIEYLNTPLSYTDVTAFGGKLYLCGPAGLFAFDASGKPDAVYRVGIDLPASPVTAMAVGSVDGPELWLATAGEGLVAFNGKTFRHIRPDAAEHRNSTTLLPLATGRLLVGTSKAGVLVYDGRTLAPFHTSLAKLPVTALAGSEADLWIGTLDRGVLHWHGGQLDAFSEEQGMPDKQVLSLAVAQDAVYAGTATGVAEFRGGRFSRKLAEGVFAKALYATADKLLIGTMEDGLYEVNRDAQRPRPVQFSEEATPGAVERITAVDGVMYALTAGALYEIGRGWKAVLRRPDALLTDRNISALSVEESGRLWIGYFDRGLDVLDPDLVRASHKEDQNIFCVNRIVQDKARDLTMVGTANGLVMFDGAGERRQVIGRQEGLIANHVTDVAVMPGGMLVGTPSGVTFADRGGMRSLYAFHGLVNNHVYALGVKEGRVLVGTLGGLSVLENGLVKANYNMANSGLQQNWITAIAPAGKDWFLGTYGSGVAQWTGAGVFVPFTAIPGRVEVNPNALLVTREHVLAGTLSHGLLVYERANARWSNLTAGLPSVNVTALCALGSFIFVGTDNGLVRIEESVL